MVQEYHAEQIILDFETVVARRLEAYYQSRKSFSADLVSMSLNLGLSETYVRRYDIVECICFAPGGFISATVERKQDMGDASSDISTSVSIWLIKNGLICAGTIQLPSQSTDTLCASSSIEWHPSGNFLYVVHNGCVHLIRTKWINTQYERPMSLVELHSSFLCDTDVKHDSFYVLLSVSKSLCDLHASSLLIADDGNLCLIGSVKEGRLYTCPWNLSSSCVFKVDQSYSSLKVNRPVLFSFQAMPILEAPVQDIPGASADRIIPPMPYIRMCRGISTLHGIVAGFTSTSALVLFKVNALEEGPRCSVSPLLRLVFPTTDYGPPDTHVGGKPNEIWSQNKNTLWKVYDAVSFDSGPPHMTTWTSRSASPSAGPSYIAVLSHRERITGDEQNMFLSRPSRIVAAVELVVLAVDCKRRGGAIPSPEAAITEACVGELEGENLEIGMKIIDTAANSSGRDRLLSANSVNSRSADSIDISADTDVYSLRVVSRRAVVANVESVAVSPHSGRGVDLPIALRHSVVHVVQTEESPSSAAHLLVAVGPKLMCFPFRVGAGGGRDPPDRNGPVMNPFEVLWTIDVDTGRSIPPVVSSYPSSPASQQRRSNSPEVLQQISQVTETSVCVAVGTGCLVVSSAVWSEAISNTVTATQLPAAHASPVPEVCCSTVHAVTLLSDPVGSSLGRPVASGTLLNLLEGSLLLFGAKCSLQQNFSSGSQVEGYEDLFADDNNHYADRSDMDSADDGSHGAVGSFAALVEGAPLYPSQGYPPYHTAKLPRSLLHDAVVNACGWKPAAPSMPQWMGEPMKHAGSAVYGRGAGLHMHQQSCGLIVARQGDGLYMACALSGTSLMQTATFFRVAKNGKSDMNEGAVSIWLYNLRTAKWKVLQPAVVPTESRVVLLPFRGNLTRSFSAPDAHAAVGTAVFTRKQYVETKPILTGIKGMQWFGNHSLCLITVRRGNAADNRSKTEQHCIEVMCRTSSSADPVVVQRCSHTIPGVNPESRRVCQPRAHLVIPLPHGFEPEVMDVVTSSVHMPLMDDSTSNASVSTASSETATDANISQKRRHSRTRHLHYGEDDVGHLRRSISRARSGDPYKYTNSRWRSDTFKKTESCPSRQVAPVSSSCIVLLGAGSYFMAYHITARQSNDAEKEAQTADASAGFFRMGRRFKPSATSTPNTFVPSSYEIILLWELDLQKDVKFEAPWASPSASFDNEGCIQFPIVSALALSLFDSNPTASESASPHSRGRSYSFNSSDDEDMMIEPALRNDDVGMVLVDSAGKVVKIELAARTITQGWRGKGTIASGGRCSSLLRLQHRLLPQNSDAPAPLQQIFLLLSAPPSAEGGYNHSTSRDLLWFPTDVNHADPASMGGTVLPAPTRRPASVLLSLPTDNECIFLAHRTPMRLQHHYIGDTNGSCSTGLGTAPIAVLQGMFIPLALVIGLLNTCQYPWTASNKSRFSCCSSLLSNAFVPFHTYNTATMKWVKYVVSHTSLHPLPLQRLADGLEMTLKKVIDRPLFTRHSSKFAVLCSVLFACDDVLFVEVLSRLSRKLEPSVSSELFPLPNCRLAYVQETDAIRARPSRQQYTLHSENTYRSVKVADSPWDQITIYELCLSRSSLSHASRFLTLACEQLGGAQSLESIAASLVLSTELLFECLRNMSMENAMECLDFCVRLDVMAAEVIHRQDLQIAPSPSVYAVAKTLSQQLVSTVSMLTPILGSDLHVLVEDTFCPHNKRTNSGLDIYSRPLYRDACTHLRKKKVFLETGVHDTSAFTVAAERSDSATAARSPSPVQSRQEVCGVCVGTSQHIYYTFLAVNQYNSFYTFPNNPAGSTSTSAAPDDDDIRNAVQSMLHNSYSGSVVRMMCKSLLEQGKFMCCATIMATITLPLASTSSSSASNMTSWVEKALFSAYSSPSPIRLQRYEHARRTVGPDEGGADRPVFKQSSLYQLLRVLGFHVQTKLCTGSSPLCAANMPFAKVMARSYPEFELRKKCEAEMYVSYLSNADDGGCLVNTSCFSGRDSVQQLHRSESSKLQRGSACEGTAAAQTARDMHDALSAAGIEAQGQQSWQNMSSNTTSGSGPTPRMGSAAVPLHGRASSKFSIPTFPTGKRVSVEGLLRGLAAAAWMTGAVDIIVLVAAMHSREDVAIACLGCQDSALCRSVIINFCIGKSGKALFAEYLDSADEGPGRNHSTDSTGFNVDEARDRLSSTESRFIRRIFSVQMRPLIDVAKDIFNFFFVSKAIG